MTILLMLVQRDPDGHLHLQKKPCRRRRASPDGLERRDLGGGAPPVQRLECRPRAVRRVPRLGGRRPSQFLCATPAQRDDLSRAELGRDDRGHPIGRRHVDRSARGPAPAAVWQVADCDVIGGAPDGTGINQNCQRSGCALICLRVRAGMSVSKPCTRRPASGGHFRGAQRERTVKSRVASVLRGAIGRTWYADADFPCTGPQRLATRN